MTSLLRSAALNILPAISLLLFAGCGSSSSGDHEEIEHTRPDHWPDTFVDLVEQLDERFATRDGSSPDEKLEDQLKWLPEVAGDTSLNEADWNEAVASGEQLVAVYQSGGDPEAALETLRRLAEKTRDDLPPFVPGRHEDPVPGPPESENGTAEDANETVETPTATESVETPIIDNEGADS